VAEWVGARGPITGQVHLDDIETLFFSYSPVHAIAHPAELVRAADNPLVAQKPRCQFEIGWTERSGLP
jgi:hypothetical protein